MTVWHVHEACKAFEQMGVFNGLSLKEQFTLTRTWARAMGLSEDVIAEGWQEYLMARSA
ncbi:MAG: hypothetical protein M0021_09990 [Clostridia bacterium]|nr:hypothetical protein [Clostridia bacterium]